MSLPEPEHQDYTLEDWKTWEGRWELINGAAFAMTPAPGTKHQMLSVKLTLAIGNALEDAKRSSNQGDCQLFTAPTDVFLPSGVVQPDLLVVCDPAKISERGIEGAPDLVVEILSPATAGKDLSRKRWAYEAAGVPEYLWVDPEERVGVLLSLEAGRYQEIAHLEWGALVNLLGGRLSIQIGA